MVWCDSPSLRLIGFDVLVAYPRRTSGLLVGNTNYVSFKVWVVYFFFYLRTNLFIYFADKNHKKCTLKSLSRYSVFFTSELIYLFIFKIKNLQQKNVSVKCLQEYMHVLSKILIDLPWLIIQMSWNIILSIAYL